MKYPIKILYVCDLISSFEAFVKSKYGNCKTDITKSCRVSDDGNTEIYFLNPTWSTSLKNNFTNNKYYDQVYVDLPEKFVDDIADLLYTLPHHKFDYVGQSEDWALPQGKACNHEWVEYNSGWTSYEYCKNCDEEKK